MKQTILIVLIIITTSVMMNGCIAPDGKWDIDGTIEHTNDEVAPTPEIVYVTHPHEIVYVTPTPNPCSGVVCDSRCFGYDLYRTACADGYCIKGTLIESNSSACGYVIPTHVPTPEQNTCSRYTNSFDCTYAGCDWVDGICQENSEYRSYTDFTDQISCEGNGYYWYYGLCHREIEPIPTPTPEPTPSSCSDLDQSILKRYDVDRDGQIDENWAKIAGIDLNASRMTQSDYNQVKYAYEHMCWTGVPMPTATPAPTPDPVPDPTFDNPLIVIEPPIYSGVVRNNGEILDISVTPNPLIAGDEISIKIDILNTGTVTSWFEIHCDCRGCERRVYSGDMASATFTNMIDRSGDYTWDIKLYWDAAWPASNVLLQTASVDVHYYTQYEVDNM